MVRVRVNCVAMVRFSKLLGSNINPNSNSALFIFIFLRFLTRCHGPGPRSHSCARSSPIWRMTNHCEISTPRDQS